MFNLTGADYVLKVRASPSLQTLMWVFLLLCRGWKGTLQRNIQCYVEHTKFILKCNFIE